MAEKLITKSFERLLDKGKHRGFITYEELGKSLGKRNGTSDNIEKALIILVDEKITFVEKKSQFQSNKKKESSTNNEEKSSDKSDDPIRMYLREMGGVELLSREGEIAIAKRIEAGKDVMINALTQSPIVGKKIFEWKEQIESQQLLVRDIIDIDSTYEDFESSQDDEELKIDKKVKSKKNDKEAYKSFFSGHTSTAFAIGTSTAKILTNYSNIDKRIVWISTLGLASGTGYFRIAADKHYFSDVFVGAIVGSLIGNTMFDKLTRKYQKMSLLGAHTPNLYYNSQGIRLSIAL